MSDVKEILDMILHDEKLLKSKAFRDRVYSDEPIIRTAAQLIKPQTPPRIKEMKGLAFTPEAYWKTSAWLFYTQGKFMEDYEDDFTYSGDFVKYYPCYRDLTTEQLRGYFSWRTRVRRGIVEKAPLPFVFIYMYELVNCIGAETPAECFVLLRSFSERYCAIDDTVKKYADTWLSDLIVYYQLDSSLAEQLEDIVYDRHLLALMDWEAHSDEEIFEALDALSAYRFKQSLYYISEPDDFKAVLVRCYVSLSVFFRDKRKNSLFCKLFGNITECSYHMFASAIFYDRQSLRSCEYSLDPIHSFSCRSGKWYCKKQYGNRSRNAHLGDLVKAIDSLMREFTSFRHKLSLSGVSKTTVKLINAEIQQYFEEKSRKEAKKLTIDLSRLSAIRQAADITREKLIVDEEELSEIREPETAEKQETVPEGLPLDKDEFTFLQALLYGGDCQKTADQCGKMVSILADSVNEKLFDLFGDTVIEFSGDSPLIIEDYEADLKKMLSEGDKI